MKIKEIKIINPDESTAIADIGANAINVDYNDTTVKAELDKLNATDNSLINIQTNQETKLVNLQTQINGLASGSPLVASSVSEMTDTSRVYVNTTDGYWYYYNGTAWVDGGVYQATEIAEDSINILMMDNTLSNNFIKNFEDESLENQEVNNKFKRVNNANQIVESESSSYAYKFYELEANKIYLITGGVNHYMCQGIIIADINDNVLYSSKETPNPENPHAVSLLLKTNLNCKCYLSYKTDIQIPHEILTLSSTNVNLHKISNMPIHTMNGYYANSSTIGNIASIVGSGTSDSVLKIYNMNRGRKYKLCGTSYYSVSAYLITDFNYKILYSASNTSQQNPLYSEYEFTAENDGFILISNYQNYETTIEVLDDLAEDIVQEVNELINEIKFDKSPLYGKKIYIAGDSISYGASADLDENNKRKTYDYYIAKRHNMNVIKDAISGSSIAYKAGRTDYYSNQRYLNMPNDADYYIFQFGTNDTAEIGTKNDNVNTTFKGAWNIVLNHLFEINPKAKVLVIPLWQGGADNYNATIEMAQYYGTKCPKWRDENHAFFVSQQNNTIKSDIVTLKRNTFLSDGTHPNDTGYKYLSTIIEDYLLKL